MAKRTRQKTSPRTMQRVARVRHALQLRAAGKSFAEIAQICGYHSLQAAWAAVAAALQQQVRAPAEDLRTLELARLDALQAAVWEQALRGEVAAIDCVLRIMGKRIGLLGLSAPAAVATSETRQQAARDRFDAVTRLHQQLAAIRQRHAQAGTVGPACAGPRE